MDSQKTQQKIQEEIINIVSQYLAHQPDITTAYIFGSLARGRFRPESDIDIAVLFSPNITDKLERFERRLELEIALQEKLHRPVQVIDLMEAPLLLQHQVRKYGKLILEKDHRQRVCFEVNSRRRYFDMQHFYCLQKAIIFGRLG